MNSIKKILLSSVLLFGINSVAKADCGTITIAEMNWASAEMFAHVDKLILENCILDYSKRIRKYGGDN